MLLVRYSHVLVCYSYVTRVYSYVTRRYSYVTCMLLVCSFSHNRILVVIERKALSLIQLTAQI